LPVEAVDGAEITTIEGLGKNGLHPVQQAWIEHQVPQCGYCQSGMIMSVVSLLDNTGNPTDEELNQAVTNVCRCGTYQKVRAAVDSLKQS
jgi:isoquinoline 1-oxidoreductase alpha subunit